MSVELKPEPIGLYKKLPIPEGNTIPLAEPGVKSILPPTNLNTLIPDDDGNPEKPPLIVLLPETSKTLKVDVGSPEISPLNVLFPKI